MPSTVCSLLGIDTASSVLFSHHPQLRHINTFSPYGYQANPQNLIGFTGAVRESVTGNYVLGNGYRLYNPLVMRFLSPDRLSPFEAGGVNAYAYCQGDPVNRADPTGSSMSGIVSWLQSKTAPTLQLTKQSLTLTKQSLLPSRSQAPTTFVGGREVIENFGRKLSDSTPFIDKLIRVNKNLASNGDTSLTPEHAQAYVQIAQRNKSGSISSTSAHILASGEWMKEQGAPKYVGATFNLAGALGAGVEDQARYKTGQVFLKAQEQVRKS